MSAPRHRGAWLRARSSARRSPRLTATLVILAVVLPLTLIAACCVSAPAVAAPTYEELLWAPWPRRPTEAEIAQARQDTLDGGRTESMGETAPGVDQEGSLDWSQFDIVSVEAIKVHEVNGEPRLGGEPGTGNHVVAVVKVRHGGSRLDFLFWNSVTKRWEFGGATNPEASGLDALYSAGYAPGWVEEGDPISGGAGPWKTVVTGGLAAAAIAIAANAARSRGRKGKLDPRATVGYVLQVSAMELRLSSTHSSRFTADAWRVLADGSFEPADDVSITLSPPAGVGAQPATAPTSISSSVWQMEEITEEAVLDVAAAGAKGGTRQPVRLIPEVASRLEVKLEPPGRSTLRPNGRDSVTITAKVILSPTLALDPTVDPETVRRSITFMRPSATEWLNVGEDRDLPDGKAVHVSASPPDPDHPGTPPESVTVVVTATVKTQVLREEVTIKLARPPRLDARPDHVELSAGTKATAEVLVWVDDAGDGDWEFRAELAEQDRRVVESDVKRTSSASATVTVTEASGALPPTDRPTETATLRILADHPDHDRLERHVAIVIAREGVYLDTITRDRDGTYHVAADGSRRPTDIDVRVYTRDDTSGEITLDATLSQSLTVEPADDTSERTSRAARLVHSASGMRPSSSPAAIHRFHTERPLPTEGTPLRVRYAFRVEGREEPHFNVIAPLALVGVDMSPNSRAWDLEMERCRRIVDEYIPAEDRARFHTLLNERGRLMGAEGLYHLRAQIWSYAETRLQQEIHEHLDRAWEHEQIEGFLDWVSWCGDIAFGVASGSLMGTGAALALGMLKPMLVSAMTAYVNGDDLGTWAWDQVGILGSVVEGCATDVDLIAKLTGKNKMLAWAAFIAYTFAREIQRDPNHSVTEAMKAVLRQLRDEGLTQFLRHFAMKGGSTPRSRPAGDGPDAARAPKSGADGPPGTGKAAHEAAAMPGAAKGAHPGADGAPKPAHEPGVATGKTTTAAGSDAGAPKPHGKPDATAPDAAAKKTPDKPDAPESETRKPPAESDAATEKAPADKPESAESPDPTKKPPASPKTDAADRIARGITYGADGAPRARKADVIEIMADPTKVRDLKTAPPEIQAAFENTRKHIYEGHDIAVENHVRTNVPGMAGKEIKVIEIRTPGKPGEVTINTDHDYTVCYKDVDPKTGHEVWIEVDRRAWEMESYRSFAEATGGPTAPPEAARRWAQQHQQVATDVTHPEASRDYSDQGLIFNEATGSWQQTAFEPNIEWVKRGESTLVDPEGMGDMFTTKVADAMTGGEPTTESFVQAGKCVRELEAVRAGYDRQHYKLGEMDAQMRAGMDIVREAGAQGNDPSVGASADAQLRAAGFKGGLSEFMGRMHGEWSAFGSASK